MRRQAPYAPNPAEFEFDEIDLNALCSADVADPLLIRVRGDSMSEEIRDGDWIMIDRLDAGGIDDIVLAETGEGYMVRRNRRRLQLVRPGGAAEFTIGKVTHVIRRLP